MRKSIEEHAIAVIKREGAVPTHHIAATYFIGGGQFTFAHGPRHPNEIIREILRREPRLSHDPVSDIWSVTGELIV